VQSHAAILEEHGLQRSLHSRKVYNYREIRRYSKIASAYRTTPACLYWA
jgi:hypothetical protein